MIDKKAEVRGELDFDRVFKLLSEGNLKKTVRDAFVRMNEKPTTAGVRIAFKKIPKKYLRKYPGINNLYRIPLPGAWRLIYTVIADSEKIVCKMLDLLTHKQYDRVFGYQSS